MFGDNKKLANSNLLKDTKDMPASYPSGLPSSKSVITYNKTNKLITALFMVTDIMDMAEPLRKKLRTLGVEIISDMALIEQNRIGHVFSSITGKVSETLEFLEIAFTINSITEMNYSILRKEFSELLNSLKEFVDKAGLSDRKLDLTTFFKEESALPSRDLDISNPKHNSKGHSIGHQKYTRIGVQKGSTLLKALKDMSDRVPSLSDVGRPNAGVKHPTTGFDILKKQRREDIINIIKLIGGSATIKDIKDKVQTSIGQASSLISCGEKTLQRELVSMVKDGVLNKTGEKRWSKYFLKN